MTNPLDGTGGNGPRGPWRIGETRVIHGKAKSGAEKTLHVTRTDREFVYDFCDASNAAMSAEARARGLEYYVVNGEMRLGHSAESMRRNAREAESRLESERARYLRMQLEADRRGNAWQDEPEPAE